MVPAYHVGMSEGGRFVMFLFAALCIWSLMHAYVLWRAWPLLPGEGSRRAAVAAAVFLGLAYLLARILARLGLDTVAAPLEWIGANWMGVLLLLLSSLLVADIVSAFGLVPWLQVPARTTALAAAAVLSAVALVLGHRPPAVHSHELEVGGLPVERDGTTVVAVSDLHVGTLIGRRWTERLVERIEALDPDMIAVVGDVLEGHEEQAASFVPVLARLRAPLGVWAVTGNHEYYGGLETHVSLLQAAGFRVLRDGFQEAAPGLVVAGIDDLTARQQFGRPLHSLDGILAGRPPGATILLSHTPWLIEEAASQGVDLMISGHTHAGQIWPFGYLVALRYPFLAGHYKVGGLHLLVGRGTGTWGPRMRLWRPAEILHITLRAARKPSPGEPNSANNNS